MNSAALAHRFTPSQGLARSSRRLFALALSGLRLVVMAALILLSAAEAGAQAQLAAPRKLPQRLPPVDPLGPPSATVSAVLPERLPPVAPQRSSSPALQVASSPALPIEPTPPIELPAALAPAVEPLPKLLPEPDWDSDFLPTPIPLGSEHYDPLAQQYVYDAKYDVDTQRPLIEWGIPFYAPGMLPRGGQWLGETNLTHPALYVYGDYRVGLAAGRNAAARTDNLAQRLNLDVDYRLTDTERFHAFVGPLNRATENTQARWLDDRVEFEQNFNLNPVTAFFEGDAGALIGGFDGTPSPFELPFTVGLVPLLFQNGIWMEDAVTGAAFAIPARHSALLDWSNFDITGFAVVDQLNSPAFGQDQHAGQALGTASFIEAYDGYIEAGYAYVHDRIDLGRSYHNLTASYTRRYLDRINNSVRVIINAGQDLPSDQRTADGALLLVESSLITARPLQVLPYLNLFAGWDRPQSVARAGVSGGILRNVGINFEPDGLNGHPTLDSSANDTFGGAVGIDLLGEDLNRQWIVELAYLATHGNPRRRLARADQWGVATRYQFPLSNRSLLRFDAMYGGRQQDFDIYGTRMEYRWKF